MPGSLPVIPKMREPLPPSASSIFCSPAPCSETDPSVRRATETSPVGADRLFSTTVKRPSSPGARKRGNELCAISGSRTSSAVSPEPTFDASNATAIRRRRPAKSGMSSGIRAAPVSSRSTRPENNETIFTSTGGMPLAARLGSPPPERIWPRRLVLPSIRRP